MFAVMQWAINEPIQHVNCIIMAQLDGKFMSCLISWDKREALRLLVIENAKAKEATVASCSHRWNPCCE
jgi:hypothetical protein